MLHASGYLFTLGMCLLVTYLPYIPFSLDSNHHNRAWSTTSKIHVGGYVQPNNTLHLVVQNHGPTVHLLGANLWIMLATVPAATVTQVCKRPVSFTILTDDAVEWMCPFHYYHEICPFHYYRNSKLRGELRFFAENQGTLFTKEVTLDFPCYNFWSRHSVE